MARLSDMSQANYSDIERGKTTPSVESLLKFAEILDVSLGTLVDGEFSQSKRHHNRETLPSQDKELIREKDSRIEFLEKLVFALAKQLGLTFPELPVGVRNASTNDMNESDNNRFWNQK